MGYCPAKSLVVSSGGPENSLLSVKPVKLSTSEVLPSSEPIQPTGNARAAGSFVHTVSAITGRFEVIDKIAKAWRQLCDEGPDGQPFYRPEFVRAYVRAFVPNKTLMVIVAVDGKRLDAVLPLVKDHGLVGGLPVRRLRGAANAHSCRFDLVRRVGPTGERAVAAIWSFLKKLPAWDVLEFSNVPRGGEVERLLGEARGDGFLTGSRPASCSPYLGLTKWQGSSEGWLQSLNPRFRQEIRRRMRRLEDEGQVNLRRIEIAEPRFLRTFYDLERAGWKGKKGTAIQSDPRTQQFYAEIAHAAEEFGYLCCYLLEVNDHVVAGSFGFNHGGRYYGLKPAYDESFSRYSPGHLMVRSVLRDLVDRGLAELDFMPPSTEWKENWTSSSRPQSHCYVFRKGFYGRLLAHAKLSFFPTVRRTIAGIHSPKRHLMNRRTENHSAS